MVKVYPEEYPLGCQPNMKSAGYYIHQHLKTNLDTAKRAIKQDWDMIFVIDGPEGSGKSVLAQQIAKYLDPNFSVDQETFTADDFKNAVLTAKKYSCIVFDEAYGALSSRRAMSKTNHTLVKLFSEMRQRNLFVILVLPSFFELDRYAAIHRTRVLIHVYHEKFKRGYYKFYSYPRKKAMYLHGKKNYNYSCVKSTFQGYFTPFHCIDQDAYKKKKHESLVAELDAQDSGNTPIKPLRQIQHECAVMWFIKNMTQKEMDAASEAMGQPKRYLREFRERERKKNREKQDLEKPLTAPESPEL